MKWSQWALNVVYLLVGGLWAYELFSLLDRNPHTPPITAILLRDVPARVMLPFLGWLFVHFLVRYAGWRILI